MEHELSAYYDITHGVGLAILTPRWMRHILAKDPTSAPTAAACSRGAFVPLADEDIVQIYEACLWIYSGFKQ